jgi:hypothetical protein
MPLERVIYHPLQNAMTGVFFPSVGGGSAVDLKDYTDSALANYTDSSGIAYESA